MMDNTNDLTQAKEIAEHVTRTLLSASKYPEFGKKGVPVSVAAEVFGKDVTWVQAGIILGWLPIGRATQQGQLVTSLNQIKASRKTNYYISPKLLWELTGFVWKGDPTA